MDQERAGIDIVSDGEMRRTELHPKFLATVAENALVSDNLTPAGVITTRGHEDTLYAMRGGFGRWSGLTEDEKRNPIDTDKPVPIVPRKMVVGVPERVDAHGQVLLDLKEADVEAAIRRLRSAGAEAVGVCFLWSFANPANETAVRRVVQRVWPEAGSAGRLATSGSTATNGKALRACVSGVERPTGVRTVVASLDSTR